MGPTMDGRRWFAFGVTVLALALAPRPAGAEATEVGEPTAENADNVPGPEAEQRYARGEAFYEGEWMPLETLYEKYGHQRDRLRYIRKHDTESQDQLNDLNREMARIRSNERKAEQPVRRQLDKVRQQLREYNHVLRQEPPAKPKLQRLPPPPHRPSRTHRNGYRSRDDRYDRARRQWERRCNIIKRQNRMKVEQYRRQVKEYQKRKNDAKQDVPQLEAKARELMKQLDEIEKQYKNKAAPTRRRAQYVGDQARDHNRRATVLEHELEAIAKALKAVPENVRHQHGIAEFEGAFQTVDDLRRRHMQTQREIDRARESLRAECEQMDVPFPEDWRHPQQDRMDKIKALIEKIKQARAASG